MITGPRSAVTACAPQEQRAQQQRDAKAMQLLLGRASPAARARLARGGAGRTVGTTSKNLQSAEARSPVLQSPSALDAGTQQLLYQVCPGERRWLGAHAAAQPRSH